MIYFNNDYAEGCHPKVLKALCETNMLQSSGYGKDEFCLKAAQMIRDICRQSALDVHFLVGGTQTNLTVIDSVLRPHQGVICAESGHIAVHETGAIEATGHKVLTIKSFDGKLTAQQVLECAESHFLDENAEHTVQPGMVYISNPTELGTIYSLSELEALRAVCDRFALPLFMDGARLGYGLSAAGNDVTMPDLARLCDVFYIGGTKVGALFGEAVVIRNPAIAKDFRYLIKQHGGMLAKGRLLGVQFSALLEQGLYFEIGAHANRLADQIRSTLEELGYPLLIPGVTNQIFPILPDALLDCLKSDFSFLIQERVDASHQAVRFCTSCATSQENVDALCHALKLFSIQ